jgi:hypothetical protein
MVVHRHKRMVVRKYSHRRFPFLASIVWAVSQVTIVKDCSNDGYLVKLLGDQIIGARTIVKV